MFRQRLVLLSDASILCLRPHTDICITTSKLNPSLPPRRVVCSKNGYIPRLDPSHYYTSSARSMLAQLKKQLPAHLNCTVSSRHVRTYASRSRAIAPSVRNLKIDEAQMMNLPPPPSTPTPSTPPHEKDFYPQERIKIITLAFLIAFTALYALDTDTSYSDKLRHAKEAEEQVRKALSESRRISLVQVVIEKLQDPALALKSKTFALVDDKIGLGNWKEVPLGYPLNSTPLVLNLSPHSKLFDVLHSDFRLSPAKLFPVDGFINKDFRPWTAITHSLLHAGIFHGLLCYVTLSSLAPPLIFLYGRKNFVLLFFGGAGLSSTLYAGAERLFNPALKMTAEEQRRLLYNPNASPAEKKALVRYYTPIIGSSGALISLATILSLRVPELEASLLITPAFKLRKMLAVWAAIDFLCFFFLDSGIVAHGAHLGGYAAGAILYFAIVKRLPPSPYVRRYWEQYNRVAHGHRF